MGENSKSNMRNKSKTIIVYLEENKRLHNWVRDNLLPLLPKENIIIEQVKETTRPKEFGSNQIEEEVSLHDEVIEIITNNYSVERLISTYYNFIKKYKGKTITTRDRYVWINGVFHLYSNIIWIGEEPEPPIIYPHAYVDELGIVILDSQGDYIIDNLEKIEGKAVALGNRTSVLEKLLFKTILEGI